MGDSPFADAELAQFMAQVGAAPFEQDVAAIRAGIAERAAARERGPDLWSVRDLVIDPESGALPARLYRPADKDRAVIVYLHGGGWTVGSVEAHDRAMRRLAATSQLAVLALDYRLAPEHPWPASVDDTVAALEWVASAPPELGNTSTGVAVAGDSAGGTLAALACLRLRDARSRALPDLHVLLYANTDLTGSFPSMTDKATGWGLDADAVRFFNRQWVPDESRWGDPDVSPLHAPDLTAMPAALVVSVEHDPIRDESEAYARRLSEAGVSVTARREAGLVHNFLLYDQRSPACAAAADRVARDIADFFG